MRLFEFSNDIVDNLEVVLRTLIGRSDSKGASQHMTWPAISNLLKNLGYGSIDYEGFKRLYDANPSLSNIVSDFNDTGVTLDTKKKVKSGQDKFDIPNAPSVDSMAHSGAQQHLRNISK